MWKKIPWAGVLLLLAACSNQPSPSGAGQTTASAAEAQPLRLRVMTLDKQTFDLTAQRGKWVVVNYWATWCGPCLAEMPELSALAAMREHIQVIGLAYEDNTPEALREFLKTHPVTYPVALLDTFSPPADFGSPRVLPTSWLIRPDGRLARKYTGQVTARMLEEDIARFGDDPAG